MVHAAIAALLLPRGWQAWWPAAWLVAWPDCLYTFAQALQEHTVQEGDLKPQTSRSHSSQERQHYTATSWDVPKLRRDCVAACLGAHVPAGIWLHTQAQLLGPHSIQCTHRRSCWGRIPFNATTARHRVEIATPAHARHSQLQVRQRCLTWRWKCGQLYHAERQHLTWDSQWWPLRRQTAQRPAPQPCPPPLPASPAACTPAAPSAPP